MKNGRSCSVFALSVRLFLANLLSITFLLCSAHAQNSSNDAQKPNPTQQTQGEDNKTDAEEVITLQQIENLPSARHRSLRFVLLLPGTADATTIAEGWDFRPAGTPASGFSIYGGSTRSNALFIGGADYNNGFGGFRLSLGPDAIQEFTVRSGNYDATFGNAGSGIFNVVHREGTNDAHHSVHGIFGARFLNASNPFNLIGALAPGSTFNPSDDDVSSEHYSPHFNRELFGGTSSFPIAKDKTHLFFSYDGFRQKQQSNAPILTNTSEFRPTTEQQTILTELAKLSGNPLIPCLAGQGTLPAATCLAILTNMLMINPATSQLNAYAVNQYEKGAAIYSYHGTSDLASMHLTHKPDADNQFSFLFTFGRDEEANPAQGLTSYSGGNRTRLIDGALNGTWKHNFSMSTANEMRLGFGYDGVRAISNAPGQVAIQLMGGPTFGQNPYLPGSNTERRWSMGDNFTFIHGQHSFVFGADVLLRGERADFNNNMAGTFLFGYASGGTISLCLQNPASCKLSSSIRPASITPLQTLSLGQPIYYQQSFGNTAFSSFNPYISVFAQDSWRTSPDFMLNVGLRYELDKRAKSSNTDTNNIAPRIGFVWNPFHNNKTVIRGGYAIAYAPVNFQIDAAHQLESNSDGVRQIAELMVPLSGIRGNSAVTSATIFQTLFSQNVIQCAQPSTGSGACITPASLTQFGISVTHTGTPAPGSVLGGVSSNFENAYSQHIKLGIESEIVAGWVVSASYVYQHTLKLPRTEDKNLLSAPSSVVGTAIFRNWGSTACTSTPANCWVNSQIFQNNVYVSNGSAHYNAGIFELKKRFSERFSLNVNYTYSKAMDDVTDYTTDYAAWDQLNTRNERGLSSFDQRRKFVFTALFTSPSNGALSGIRLAPAIRYNTSHPFSLLAGFDANGDYHVTNDRPLGAGRNTGIGPGHFTWDMRLSKRFTVGKKATCELLVEAINLSNHVNYTAVNNVMGGTTSSPYSGRFNVQGSSYRAPTSSLGYTSADEMRHVQIGTRLTF